VEELTNTDPFVGMPDRDRRFLVRSGEREWGEIRCGGACKDDYRRINVYPQDRQHFVKLQAAAIESWKAAEKALGFTIVTTGSWRACATQAALFAQDSHRFAHPKDTAHTRGLAVDVSMNLGAAKLAKVHKALLNRSWHQARPDDEPWHYSFGLQV
jgi:hypothetical protein